MVTKLITRPASPVTAAAEELGVPLRVQPWWGSLRGRHAHQCRVCNLFIDADNWCPGCRRWLRPNEVKLVPRQRIWLCPGGLSYNQIKWPEVRNDVVVVWEGPCRDHCGGRFHKHRQDLEVVDVGESAFLLRVAIYNAYTPFLVGMDDGHPFVCPVLKRLSTVQDAFDWLVPNKVREALVLGKDVKRQGDWFFVPYDKEPLVKSPFVNFAYRPVPFPTTGTLYRRAPLLHGAPTRHTGSLVVYKNFPSLPHPVAVVKGIVKAPDHPPLQLDGWHLAIRTRSTPGGNRDGQSID